MSGNEEINWLECLPWDGDEKSLPLGGEIRAAGLTPERLVYRWIVADPESEEGSRLIPPSAQIGSSDVIIGAVMNEKLIATLVSMYGERFALITDPSTGKKLTRREWYEKYGTDGLALLAVRNKKLGARKPFQLGGR